jgi:hypothetical protein
MRRQGILFAALAFFLSATTPVLAETYRQDGVHNCIAWTKQVNEMMDYVCKTNKCSGPSSLPRDDVSIRRACVCQDGILQAKLSPHEYNVYVGVSDKNKTISKEEESQVMDRIRPAIEQADKTCGF